MNKYSFKVENQFNNFTVLDFLKANNISLEIIKKVKFGGIYINQDLLTDINKKLTVGDVITIILPNDERNKFAKKVNEKLTVLYEDEYLVAVLKPSGVLTHLSKYNESESIEEAFYSHFYSEDFLFRPINRLDKDTSGVLLIAKDMLTASLIGSLIKDGKVEKRYKAVVVGTPTSEHFFIEKPIERESENSVKRVCSQNGKYAKTECFFIKKVDGDKSLLEIKLHTGRTHQIRVHLASIGLPLYADGLYGEKVSGKTFELIAYKIEFTHPFTKKKITIAI